jgi:hypothetical protein
MTNSKQCGVSGCLGAVACALDGRSVCVEHFISLCYARLDAYDEIRKGSGLKITDTDSARRFIQECTRAADGIEHAGQNLNNLDRAKLVHIILSASELGRHLRRSPRKVATIPVKISSEALGAWEEETETVLVSRHGALVRCKHPAKAGDTLRFQRADTGDIALARVAWQRFLDQGEVRIGVEFVACENFWGLDWGVVEEAR